MTNVRYRLIDEASLSILGTFDSQGEAVDVVASLLSVNSDDFLDELTIANDDGPLLYGDSLRDALRSRQTARADAALDRGQRNHDGRPVEAVAAKRAVSTS